MSNGLLKGKTGVVLGVANQHSIAWACARACADAGAKLVFNYL
ncbi:MAG: NADH-specific enoyl-ACP reductase, partial [Candidatus Hydrogenedentota bacterium]